jgi:hypothetical protein
MTAPSGRAPGVLLLGPLTKRSRLDDVIAAPPTRAPKTASQAVIGRAVLAGPWVAWSASLLAEAGLQVLSAEAGASEGGSQEVGTVLTTKTSHTATHVTVSDRHLGRLARFAFR